MLETFSTLPAWYIMTFVFIMGLVFGSFLNVVGLRALSGESIVLPPSKCPKCGNKIKWYHNIPVLSYIFLMGKCAYCKNPISFQYPLVELLTGLSFLFIYYQYGFSWNTLFCCGFISLIIVLSICDFKEKVIFTHHTYILAALGLLYNLLNIRGGAGFENFLNGLFGLICGFLFMMLLVKLTRMLTGKEAFGEGDAYMLGAVGAIIGYKFVLLSFFVAVILQVVGVLPTFIFSYIKSKQFKTIGALATFGVIAACYFIFHQFLFSNKITYVLYNIILLSSGLLACKRLLSDIKEGRNIEPLPLGPMLLFGGILAFAYQDKIIDFITSLFLL